MRIFKTKEFARYARKERVSDEALIDAIDRAERGLIDADLGGNLIKQCVGRRCFFVHGFAKSQKADLVPSEFADLRDLGALLLGYSDETIKMAIAAKELVEVTRD